MFCVWKIESKGWLDVWVNVVRKHKSEDRGHHENTGAMDMSRNLGQGLKLSQRVEEEFGL